MGSGVWFKQFRDMIYLTFAALTFVSTVSFSTNPGQLDPAALETAHLEKVLPSIRGAIKAGELRQRAIDKIIAISIKYNPTEPLREKRLIASAIYEMSIKYPNLDVELICATITHESALTWRPDVQSWAGAMGLMQILPRTGRYLSKLEGISWTSAEDILNDPILNIRMGCRYLSMLIESYDLEGGLAAYNGGEKRVAMWLASGRDNSVLYKETQKYIPAILRLYSKFKTEAVHS